MSKLLMLAVVVVNTLLCMCTHYVEGNKGLRDRVRYSMKCACGTRAKLNVVGQVETKSHKHPWLAAIRLYDQIECGGSLINDRYVLTAAHCVDETPIDGMDVLLGVHYATHLDKDVQIKKISKVVIHPNYTDHRTHFSSDIALVMLEKEAGLAWNINPICLPSISIGEKGERGMHAHGDIAYSIGWTREPDAGSFRPILGYGRARTMSRDECVEDTKYSLKEVEEDNFCAMNDGVETCTVESGGTLTVKVLQSPVTMEQIGIVSQAVGCADHQYPGIYVNISHYLDWIDENTQDARYCRF